METSRNRERRFEFPNCLVATRRKINLKEKRKDERRYDGRFEHKTMLIAAAYISAI